MIFAWDEVNREHIAKHAVTCAKAEEIVENATAPYPAEIGNDKLIVWGATNDQRLLQVIYTLKHPEEVAYNSVSSVDWTTVQAEPNATIIRIIHAMDLTPTMKRLHRRRRR